MSRRGFTLMEMVVAMSVTGLVLAGAASAVIIATWAMDDGTGGTASGADAGEVMEQVLADLRVATGFTERTPTAVTVTVPDRDGDGQAEVIRYAWSGAPGAPLTRQCNGGAAAVLADDVRHFNLTHLTRLIGPPPPPPPQESGEMLLISHDDAPGGTLKDYTLDKTHRAASYFKPTLPANAVSWKITRVKFYAVLNGATTDTLAVQIRPSDAAMKPAASVLASVQIPEAQLGASFMWTEVSFGSCQGLAPASGYCLVLAQATLVDKVAKVKWEDAGSPMTANAHWMTSADSGATWTAPNSTQDLRFYVYGTVTTEGPPQ